MHPRLMLHLLLQILVISELTILNLSMKYFSAQVSAVLDSNISYPSAPSTSSTKMACNMTMNDMISHN